MKPNPYEAPKELGCELPTAVNGPDVPIWVAIFSLGCGIVLMAAYFWLVHTFALPSLRGLKSGLFVLVSGWGIFACSTIAVMAAMSRKLASRR